jgi:hypothetical protein
LSKFEKLSKFEFKNIFLRVDEDAGITSVKNSEMLKIRAKKSELTVNPVKLQRIMGKYATNLCDYDMTTNNPQAVKMTHDSSRRFLQIETTSYYKNNVLFFNNYIMNIEENSVALRQIYEGLVKFDYKEIVPSLDFQDVLYKPTTAVVDCAEVIEWITNDFTSKRKIEQMNSI